MKLVRLLLTLAVLGGLAYGAVTVPLGQKTLWGHIKAIAGTEESKQLVEGVKQKADHVLKGDSGPLKTGDELSEQERQLLRKLIREKLGQGGGAPQGAHGAGAAASNAK